MTYKPDHLQFCYGDQDITGEFHRETDATEVRAWDDEGGVIVAVHETTEGRWEYQASDYGPHADWDIHATFESWEEALRAFGCGNILE
ncbi:hypothetical protein [Gordonia sihwensis]|uniref:hypothetical protein n=1 Tax=Gordonia sihwensis TaxID=173559 RepID=UPI003D954ED1